MHISATDAFAARGVGQRSVCPKHDIDAPGACSTPGNPRRGREDRCQFYINILHKMLKGGSHLCASDYCRRYRPAAIYGRSMTRPDTSAFNE